MDKLYHATKKHAEAVYNIVLEKHQRDYKKFLAKVDRQAERCKAWETLPKDAQDNLITGVKKLLKRRGIK